MLDHINVQAADVEASAAFYLRTFAALGMTEARSSVTLPSDARRR
jgi:catechol 2,3-dioxygenase-like lactoylglutathione lyase family enzyme